MAKKTYSAAFKAKVVLGVLQEEHELSAIASKYNLTPNLDFSHPVEPPVR